MTKLAASGRLFLGHVAFRNNGCWLMFARKSSKEEHMATYPNKNIQQKANETKRVNHPVDWLIGAAFLVAPLGVLLFMYDGRDTKTTPGPNTPNVVSNPTGSK
jgi:hypothetical protein